MASSDQSSTNTDDIKNWRSIVTLVVFVLTNLIVLFPFRLPIPAPQSLRNRWWDLLAKCRIISRRPRDVNADPWSFPVNFSTAPLIADLFLLAILAIGKDEVRGGTIGTDNIYPIYIMLFFLTLAYIAISIDASGLIRWLAFKVLQKGGKNGRLLFFYLYAFFFIFASFVGNDPIVLSGTAFLAYLTRVSSNIAEPTAWIFTQFSVANVASAILVSSNPTNLVLAGAFEITFIDYTANMIVPVLVTMVVLFPFLLFVVFPKQSLIPHTIELHELPEERRQRAPVNPNMPNARAEKAERDEDEAENHLLSLEEIMNPFLDRKGAVVGGVIMAITLIAILVLNAVADRLGTHFEVFYVTLPAAVVVLSWDLFYGWKHKQETRAAVRKLEAEIAEAEERKSRVEVEEVAEKQAAGAKEGRVEAAADEKADGSASSIASGERGNVSAETAPAGETRKLDLARPRSEAIDSSSSEDAEKGVDVESGHKEPATLKSKFEEGYRWSQVTFPTVTTVFSHLPFPLVPFGLCMFVLVQALVTKGWVAVFAYGWDHWVNATGVVGAIGGMGFLGVVLCNFAGTNIGTTILLCRVVQTWVVIHQQPGAAPIDQRTFWATVYAMAVGVNYGAFSTAFSASLAGMLWRDILARKHIYVRQRDFARVNLPIISITMVVGLAVLVGEVYLTRSTEVYTG